MFLASILTIIQHKPPNMLFKTAHHPGINVGSYYAIGTLLNPIILEYFPVGLSLPPRLLRISYFFICKFLSTFLLDRNLY